MKKLVVLVLTLLTICLSAFPIFGCDSQNANGDIVNVFENHQITFDTNGGSKIEQKRVKILTSSPNTYKPDCLFDGWYFDEQLTQATSFPLEIQSDLTLYAKWLKLKEAKYSEDCSLKQWTGYNSSISWDITPTDFEIIKLASKGYYLQIYFRYDVYYEKDYDVLWDIGYMGAPKYAIDIYINGKQDKQSHDLKTTTKVTSKSFVYIKKMEDLIDQKITLKLSTANIQNIVHFKNIRIEYECTK